MRLSKLCSIFAIALLSGCASARTFTPMGALYPIPKDLSFRGVNKAGQPVVLPASDPAVLSLVCSWPDELKLHEEECRK